MIETLLRLIVIIVKDAVDDSNDTLYKHLDFLKWISIQTTVSEGLNIT